MRLTDAGRARDDDHTGRHARILPDVEWFIASGRVTGFISVLLALVVLVSTLISHGSWIVVVIALLFGLLAYVALLRPRVGLGKDELVLRQMFTTQHVSLATVTSARIGRTLVIRTEDGKRYVSPALGRSLRHALKPGAHDPLKNYADLVEDKIMHASDTAREQREASRS